jgi:hypothetical protein
LKHLNKMVEPPSAALDRGAAIHKQAERYATGQARALPSTLTLFRERFRGLRDRRRHLLVEQQLALTSAWEPTDWFGRGAWLRVVMDCFDPEVGLVIDYKTGRERTESLDQLGLYAIAALAYRPDLERVTTELWYLDSRVTRSQVYDRESVVTLKKTWLKRAKPMLADARFSPTPGDHCRWCAWSQAKEGVCQY